MNDKNTAERTPTGRLRFGPSTFLPDPSKWIQTGSASRKPLQRPLVGFKHGFATPPSTVKRTPTPAGRARPKALNTTAAAPSKLKVLQDRQSTLSGFLTPPKTESSRKKRQRTTYDDKENTARRKHLYADRATDPHPNKPQFVPSSPEDDFSTVCFPPLSQKARGDVVKTKSDWRSARRQTSSPYKAHPSDIPVTPIPDDILQKHSRLCGQDPGYLDAIPSPWAAEDKKGKQPAWVRADEGPSRISRGPKEHGSAISELAINVTSSSRRGAGKTKGFNPDLHQSSRRHMPVVSHANISPIGRPSTPSRAKISKGRASVHSPLPRTSDVAVENHVPAFDPPTKSKEDRSSSVDPSIPTSPLCNMRNTPQKHRSPHHRVTPPKSRPSGNRRDAASSFILPAPPAQPVFKTDPIIATRPKDFEPVDQAETLLTWSLGARRADQPGISPCAEPRPALAPIQRSSSPSVPSRPASSSQSMPGSELSQPFPALLPSPPGRRSSALVMPTESVSEPKGGSTTHTDTSAPVPPIDKTDPNLTTPIAPASRWDRLHRGILSVVPVDPVTPLSFTPQTSTGGTARKSKTARRSDGLTQPTLAAYGATKTILERRIKRPFELAFEDEAELEFSSASTAEQVGPPRAKGNGRETELVPVPAAPLDPRLRPSAVAHLQAAPYRPRESPPETALLERLASATQQSETVRELSGHGPNAIRRQPVAVLSLPDLSTRSPDEPMTSSPEGHTTLSTSSGVMATESMWAFRNALSSGSERS